MQTGHGRFSMEGLLPAPWMQTHSLHGIGLKPKELNQWTSRVNLGGRAESAGGVLEATPARDNTGDALEQLYLRSSRGEAVSGVA